MTTHVDPRSTSWDIHDEVRRLRVFGSEKSYELRAGRKWMLGASDECEIRIEDPTGRVSRRHAVITREDGDLVLTDLGSRNGTRLDGDKRKTFSLTPGLELEVGPVKLVAESDGIIALRELLCRYLGWSPERSEDVDRALRIVRETMQLRTILLLAGAGSLVGIVHRLHAACVRSRAFVVHEPGESGVTALERAADGVLYMNAERLPDDMEHVLSGLRMPERWVRLIIGTNAEDVPSIIASAIRSVSLIDIPSMQERRFELERLLLAYAEDARVEFGCDDTQLREHDLTWAVKSKPESHDDAAELMQRVVASRVWGIRGGAERLEISHVALLRYLRRRGIPS